MSFSLSSLGHLGSDVCQVVSDFQYFVIFVDDFSRITYLYLTKDQSELYSIFKSFFMKIKTQFDTSICVVRSNNAREYYFVNFHSSLVTTVLFIRILVLGLHDKMELPNASYAYLM